MTAHLKVLVAFGTRPEAIKMAPVIKALAADTAIDLKIAVTAQHRQILDQVLDLFDISPDYDLNSMSPGQTLEQITSRVLEGMSTICQIERPEMILVQGDTTTTFASALAAFYNRVDVGHIEAGLRTGNKLSPYPEEMNRRLTSTLADLHFAPTEVNRANLLREGVDDSSIAVTGNTVIDALHMTVDPSHEFEDPALGSIDFERKRVLLLTCHRRENWGAPMREIFRAIRDVAVRENDLEIVFPVHPNPTVREAAEAAFADLPAAHLIAPLGYQAFSNLMDRSHLILSDSGGVQEEAPALGKPVLVLRDTTERPEAVTAGTVRLAGVTYEEVSNSLSELLTDQAAYRAMAHAENPYGDGRAAERILAGLKRHYASCRPGPGASG